MREIFKTYFLLLFCALSANIAVQAQNTVVSAAFAADTVVIGDAIAYDVTIKTLKTTPVLAVSNVTIDSIISGYQTQVAQMQDTTQQVRPKRSDYDIIDYGKWGNTDDNGFWQADQLDFDTTTLAFQVLYENKIMIRFWEPGMQFINHPPVVISNGDSTEIIQSAGATQVFVAPPFDLDELQQQDSIDISPLKPIIKEPAMLVDYLMYLVILGILALLLLAWLLVKYLRKREEEKEAAKPVVKTPAHVTAISRLDKLDSDQVWQNGAIKEYQSRLTFIIREYLENRYKIPALETTTDEITDALKAVDFDEMDEVELKNILQVADMVKFAKMTPAEELHQQFLDKAYKFVNKTKRIPKVEVDEQ